MELFAQNSLSRAERKSPDTSRAFARPRVDRALGGEICWRPVHRDGARRFRQQVAVDIRALPRGGARDMRQQSRARGHERLFLCKYAGRPERPRRTESPLERRKPQRACEIPLRRASVAGQGASRRTARDAGKYGMDARCAGRRPDARRA